MPHSEIRKAIRSKKSKTLNSFKRLLIKEKINVKSKTLNGFTVLHTAACIGRPHHIKALIELGCDINSTTDDGNTPLLQAINESKLDNVKMCLECGAKTNVSMCFSLSLFSSYLF